MNNFKNNLPIDRSNVVCSIRSSFFLHFKYVVHIWLTHFYISPNFCFCIQSYPTCSGEIAPGIAADMHFRDDVIAFIGPACAFALEPVAQLAAYWNTPIITGMGDQVSNWNDSQVWIGKNLFTVFFRMSLDSLKSSKKKTNFSPIYIHASPAEHDIPFYVFSSYIQISNSFLIYYSTPYYFMKKITILLFFSPISYLFHSFFIIHEWRDFLNFYQLRFVQFPVV